MKLNQNLNEKSNQEQEEGVKCRYCGSHDCFRVPRSMLVKSFLGFLPLKHYRCAKCLRTFYSLK